MNKKLLIKKLEDKIDSLISFERCLGLPIGITKKWKSGEVKLKPEDIALIKLVTVFPWFLELADNNFDPIFAEKKLLQETINSIYKEKK